MENSNKQNSNSKKSYRWAGKAFSGRGQQALCVERFMQGPANCEELVEFLKAHPKGATTQTWERIAAYYICVLKKSGHIEEFIGERAELEAAGQLSMDELIG
jgi:hypothetical protein